MFGHQSAVLTMNTYADLPDDLELVAAALDDARNAALSLLQTVCGLERRRPPDRSHRLGA